MAEEKKLKLKRKRVTLQAARELNTNPALCRLTEKSGQETQTEGKE